MQVAPTKDNTLILGFAGKTKQYTEVEKDLFREMDAGVSLVPGISPRLLAFQQNDQGEVTGFVMDGLPFMSLRKLAVYATPNFNYALLGFSMLVFLGVLLRRFFQRAAFRTMPAADRSALGAAVYVSAANWLTLIVGVVAISAAGDSLFTGIPLSLKLWLVLPVIATLLGIYLLVKVLGVWSKGQLSGVWARLRYSVVALSGLFMCWFYYFWNILGWQYK